MREHAIEESDDVDENASVDWWQAIKWGGLSFVLTPLVMAIAAFVSEERFDLPLGIVGGMMEGLFIGAYAAHFPEWIGRLSSAWHWLPVWAMAAMAGAVMAVISPALVRLELSMSRSLDVTWGFVIALPLAHGLMAHRFPGALIDTPPEHPDHLKE